jgi:hypothetical protein
VVQVYNLRNLSASNNYNVAENLEKNEMIIDGWQSYEIKAIF